MKRKRSALLLFLLFYSFSYSQEREEVEHEKPIPNNFYTKLGVGLTHPIYRDFATSPLFYSGLGIDINSTWLKRSVKRERTIAIGLGVSAQTARVPESQLIQPGALSGFANFRIFYQELWQLPVLSDAKNNTKIGGALITTQNVRGNPSLQNNAMGLENISNLMASAQWTRDISRTSPKTINLGFWKPTLKPAKRELRVLLNVGVLNFNYRPGYAYAYDSELKGTETDPVSWAFSNYQWSLNGWRLKTQVEYTKCLPNGNARSLSYIWEAAHAPGQFEDFQMASHRLQYTIYFHTKKR